MARNVADLTYQSKVMIDLAAETPDAFDGEQLMVKPWRDEKPKKLRIGWYIHSAGVKVSRRRIELMVDESRLCKSSENLQRSLGESRS